MRGIFKVEIQIILMLQEPEGTKNLQTCQNILTIILLYIYNHNYTCNHNKSQNKNPNTNRNYNHNHP
jgi:hypothetical protein